MAMRNMMVVVAALLLAVAGGQAQFKSQVDRETSVSEAYQESANSSLFGWFDPAKFQMHHSLSMSYMTGPAGGMSLGTYTNSMLYQFDEKLNARADVSLSYSPFSSMSRYGGMGNSFSGIYLSRAEINYRPWENFILQVQYRQLPYGSYSWSPFYDPRFWGSPF
jgi:hypothetical protein